MTSPVSSPHRRLADNATPISIFPLAERCPAERELGMALDRMSPVGAAVLSGRLDVPPGEWLLWVEARYAMWIGGRADALPAPVRRRLERGDDRDIEHLLNALADVSVWLREAALLVDGDWTPSRRAYSALSDVATQPVAALSGIFVDRLGRAARLELMPGPVCWTDCPALAVEWLRTTVHLPAPQ